MKWGACISWRQELFICNEWNAVRHGFEAKHFSVQHIKLFTVLQCTTSRGNPFYRLTTRWINDFLYWWELKDFWSILQSFPRVEFDISIVKYLLQSTTIFNTCIKSPASLLWISSNTFNSSKRSSYGLFLILGIIFVTLR